MPAPAGFRSADRMAQPGSDQSQREAHGASRRVFAALRRSREVCRSVPRGNRAFARAAEDRAAVVLGLVTAVRIHGMLRQAPSAIAATAVALLVALGGG